MSEAITVPLPGRLQDFVNLKSNPEHSLFSSPDEYIRDLIRRDYDAEDQKRWAALRRQLAPGMSADPSEFVELSAAEIIAEAKRRKASAHAS
ncbi:MAG: antitoxin ParD1/3/4 [Verrucomicrobiales bacterium]|jgi:antitoxin ParD1/3/4